MGSWIDFEGKNIEAALKKAEKKINISRDKLEYETITSGSSGIFGLVGAKNAVIRVRDPKAENSNRGATRNGSALSDREMVQSLVDETFSESRPSVSSAKKPAKPQKEKSLSEKIRPSKTKIEKTRSEKTEPPAPKSKEPINEEGLCKGQEVLQKILDLITEEATASFESNNGQVTFSVDGGNAAVLIGKRGQTLKAMQHIVEKVVWKESGSGVSVQVDVEQYMEKRAASLKDLALRLAEKTRQTGKSTTINRIDAFERKIVHDVLRKDKRVKTKSVGSGDFRNVVIQSGQQRGKGNRKPRRENNQQPE